MQLLLYTPGQSCSVVCMGNCLALKQWLCGLCQGGQELELEQRERERERELEREIEMVSLRSASAELAAAVAGAAVRAEAVVCGFRGGGGGGAGASGLGELSEQDECVVVAEKWSGVERLLGETGEMRERVMALNSRVNVLLEEV